MGQVEEVDTKQAEVESLRREASKLCHVILCLAPVSFRLLQTVPAPTVSNCFKVLQTASKCFKLLLRMFRRAPFCEARDTLLQAARDGRLASAFKEMRKASVLQFGFMWVPGVTKTKTIWYNQVQSIFLVFKTNCVNAMLFGIRFCKVLCGWYGFCMVWIISGWWFFI